MTTICAIYDQHRDGVWIGSDTRVTTGSLALDCRPKWHIHNQWAIGVSGAVRHSNTIEHHWPELVGKHANIYELATALRAKVKDDGFKEQDEKSPWWEIGTIITDSKTIWRVGSDFCYLELPRDQFISMGSGSHFALGAATGLRRFDQAFCPKKVMEVALGAAITLDHHSGGQTWLNFLKAPVVESSIIPGIIDGSIKINGEMEAIARRLSKVRGKTGKKARRAEAIA